LRFPSDGDKPNTKSNKVVITVIRINGINTMNQEITPKPRWQRMLRPNVKSIITINLKKAVLYIFLNISIIICVSENTRYSKAGGHRFLMSI